MQGLTFATWMLMAASFGMTAVASVGSYQALFVMPEYFASPPGSLRRYQARQILEVLAATSRGHAPGTGSAASRHRSTDRRVLVLAATICYSASWIATLIWFIPGVIEFNKVDPRGVSAARQATPVSAAAVRESIVGP